MSIPERYGHAYIPATEEQLKANGGKHLTEEQWLSNGGKYPTKDEKTINTEKSKSLGDIIPRKV